MENLPPEILESARKAIKNVIPEKSFSKYETAYNKVKAWQKTENVIILCEEVMLAYFEELSHKFAPTTLWSIYSMLKCTLNAFERNNIEKKFPNLIAFLSNNTVDYKLKKAMILSPENVNDFLKAAPDLKFLATKVRNK